MVKARRERLEAVRAKRRAADSQARPDDTPPPEGRSTKRARKEVVPEPLRATPTKCSRQVEKLQEDDKQAEWEALKPFLAAADRCLHESELRAIELAERRFRASLEAALQAGDLAEAARISDEKSALEAQARLQRARERQAYATDLCQRQQEAYAARKKKGKKEPLHWRFDHKRSWERKDNM